jgi:chromosome segregation ATPase
MAKFRKQAIQDYRKMQAARDKALQDLSEARAQLAAIDMRENDRPSCQDCRKLAEEIIQEALKVKDLEAEMEQLDRDLGIAQGSITGYKNSFAITDKIINEQHAEIAEQKAEISEQKAEIARLNAKLAEL